MRLYLVSNSARLLAEVDRPTDIRAPSRSCWRLEATGSQSRLGDARPPGAHRAARSASDGDRAAFRRPDHRGRAAVEGIGARRAQRRAALCDRPGKRRAGPRHRADRAAGRRRGLRRRRRAVPGQALGTRLCRREGRGAAQGARARLERPGCPLASSIRRKSSCPADGQPKRVELVHHPKTTGERTFIIEVDKLPRELQTDNNRIERVVNVRKEKLRVLVVDSEPRYEFRYLKNYLERDETIDLNVVLLSSDPNYSEQDRSAIPTFPAAKDDLFTYDVVIFGDADISYLSQSQLQNLVEFVTEKGGGVLFVAGDLFNPLAYHGTPLELLLPIELSDARNPTAVGTTRDVVSPRADARRAGQPDLPVRRRRRLEHEDLGGPARAVLVLRGTPEETRRPGAGRASDRDGSDGKLPLVLYQFVGAGKSMFHAFDDTWRWRYPRGRPVLRAVLGPDDPLSGEVAAGRPATGRGPDRPPPISARPADPVSRAVSQRRARAQVGRRRRSRSAVPGRACASSRSSWCPEPRNVFEGALPQAAEGDYEVRLLPPPVLEGPIPTTTFRVDAPVNEFERIEMNGPELLRAAELTGGKFYTPLDADALLERPAETVAGAARYRSADSALEHLAGAGAFPGAAYSRSGFSENANKWYNSCLIHRARGVGIEGDETRVQGARTDSNRVRGIRTQEAMVTPSSA